MVLAVSNRISRVPPYSGYCYLHTYLRVQDFHLLWCNFPDIFHFLCIQNVAVLLPPDSQNYRDLGPSPFDRHYLGNHYCFLFLRVLRCFSSPGLPPPITREISGLQPEGLPHSDTCGYNGYLLLPADFRSLSRPSSPLRAKASTVCPCLLSQVFFYY